MAREAGSDRTAGEKDSCTRNRKQAQQKYMHHKFCILDIGKVLYGSFNWSQHAPDNIENVVSSTNKDLARAYDEEF